MLHKKTKNIITQCFIDSFVFFTVSTQLLWLLVISPTSVWIILTVGGMTTVTYLYIAYKHRVISSNNWENGYTDWFNISKFVTSVCGVVALNLFRQKGWYNENTHVVIIVLLVINILEAVIRDIQHGYIPNALVGTVLIATIPFSISDELKMTLLSNTDEHKRFVFPLSSVYVFLYTTWNAAFSYGNDMSLLTRLILLPPIFLSWFLDDFYLWLGSRVLLLVLNMMLRTIQITRIYTPGKSLLTPFPGTIRHSSTTCKYWGWFNLALSFNLFYECFLDEAYTLKK